MKKPYKTNAKWRLFEPEIEKAVQNDWKSITYRTFSRHVLKTSKNLIKPMEHVDFKNAKTRVKNLIKPVVYEDIWRHFWKCTSESIQKALGFSLKVEAVFRFCKTSKTVSKTVFWSIQKSWSKYLIKPVVYEAFWSHFRKMASEKSKKALRL